MGRVKHLLALVGLGAGTGVAVQVYSGRLPHHHDEGQLEGPPEEHSAWHSFKDRVASSSASHATHRAVELLRSLQRAWQQRAAELKASSAKLAGSGSSMPTSVATFLALLAEDRQEHRLLRLAGTRLLDWLLEAAVEAPGGAEQQAVQRWLLAVLQDDEAATLLLERHGAPARLLRLAMRTPELSAALTAALGRGLPPQRLASLDDIAATAEVVAGKGHELRRLSKQRRREVQRVALQLLSAWAAGSLLNCTHIADASVGPALTELAAASATGSNVDGIQLEIANLMSVLAAESPRRRQLQMGGWLYHLLCFAADASAAGRWHLADAALGGFAACLFKGCELPSQLMRERTLPLLERLASQPVARPMRPAIATVVRAMAEGSGVVLPLQERERWGETLLGWLVEEAAPQGGSSSPQLQQQQEEMMAGLVSALAALASPAGADGLHVAHSWMAELITHLSRQIQPYGAVSPPEPPASANGRRWYQWGSSSSQAPAGAAAPEPGAAQAPLLNEEAERALASAASDEANVVGGASASWWWWLWPFGSSSSSSSSNTASSSAGGSQQAAAAAVRPSDPELALYINAAPVGPLYARSVAADLLEASGKVGEFQEPPPSAEELMSPAEVAVYSEVAAAIDMEVADKALCQALKVLCALASGGDPRRQWLLSAGILPLLRRLALEHAKDVSELTSPDYYEDVMPLCIQRQTVRMLAMISCDMAGAVAVQQAGWVPWLQDVALSEDCKLGSSAARALLHIESAQAGRRKRRSRGGFALLPLPQAPPELLPDRIDVGVEAAAASGAAAANGGRKMMEQGARAGGGCGGALVHAVPAQELLQDALHDAQAKLRGVKRKLERQLDAVRDPVPPEHRLVLQDGMHLFDPLAPHHSVLAREGTNSASSDAPLVDIVFVHGIRGGAFATWRREGSLQRGQAAQALERSLCWPAAWVVQDIPQARLLSAEYAAPVTGWEGESLSFKHTVAQLMGKLKAAGVGQRPVVFVCHSMGGLVVKEMLANARREQDPRLQQLASSAIGVVFYAVPHFGSKLADWGWQLRYLGASPARAVAQLKTGPHLEQLNAEVRALCKSGQLPVLSFSEGQPMKLAYVRTHVVPHESAYPGYGEFVVLEQHDHINVCKPHDRSDPSYARLIKFLQQRVHDVSLQRADERQAAMDHMEPAL